MNVRMMMMGRKPAGAGGFADPSDLPTLAAWYDPSDGTSLTLSGSRVTQINDLSGLGNHLTEKSVGVGPNSGTRSINSLNVLDFIPNDSLTRTSVSIAGSGTGWSVFGVCVLDTVSGTRSILDWDDVARCGQVLRHDGSTAQSIGFTTGGAPASDSGPTVSTGTVYILESINTGTTIEMLVNGVSSGGATSMGGTQRSDSDTLGMGAWDNGAGQFFDGGIGEIICCSTDIGTSSRDDVRSYLADKWGVTL